MVKRINCLKTLIGCYLILLQVSDSWCEDLPSSVVRIYSDRHYLCAGALVKNNFVVTSNECLRNQRKVSGLIVTSNEIRNGGEASFVSEIIRHEDFTKYNKKEGNVALLKLKTLISGPNIKPAKLCNLEQIPLYEDATIYSWNLARGSLPERSLPLHKYNIKVTDDADTCNKKYNLKLTDDIFCGADDKTYYSLIDGGGPVAIRGQFCAIFHPSDLYTNKSYPGLFTSLADQEVLKFIKQSMSKLNEK